MTSTPSPPVRLSPVALLGLIAFAALLNAGGCVSSRNERPSPVFPGSKTGPVAVLTLQNLTDDPSASDLILPLILDELRSRGEAVIGPAELRPTLREHRIRISSGIRAEDARRIAEATGADRILFGSIDLLRRELDPELALSLRIVRVSDMHVVAAASDGATGEDFAGLFGIGRITKAEDLAPPLVASLFRDLERRPRIRAAGTLKLAIIPFDNLSKTRAAGSIATSVFLAGYLREGFEVVEPGTVEDAFRRAGAAPRGEISVPLLRRIEEDPGVDLALAGVVQRFETGEGASLPGAEFGIRLIRVSDGRILETENRSVDGRDGETILGLGRTHSLSRLLLRSAEESARKMVRTNRERIASLKQ